MRIVVHIFADSKEIEDLCKKYWQSDDGKKFSYTVKEISKAFNIKWANILKIVSKNCIAYSEEDVCFNCGAPRKLKSRSDFLERKSYYPWSSWKCADCKEDEKQQELQRLQQADKIRYALIDYDLKNSKEKGIDIEKLTFEDGIYLLSLIRTAGSEDLTFIHPYEKTADLLSPTSELDKEILNQLYQNKIICIHPVSSSESITIEGGKVAEFFPFKVHWVLPLPEDGPSMAKFMESLEDIIKSDKWPDQWSDKAEGLYRKIALHECYQYLRVVLDDHGFDLKIGKKTELVLTNLLKNFSIAQAYNFIWKATRDAASFYMRKRASKRHAANIVPGAIQRMAERALAEGWNIKPYRRDFRAPQSILSQVLFNTALKIGERSFADVPPKH